MKNNRDNFKSGKKPFSRDGGRPNKSGDRSFGFNKSDNSGRPSKFNKFGEKSNYSSNSSSYAKNNDRGYSKFKSGGENKPYSKDGGYKKSGDFKRSDRNYSSNNSSNSNNANRFNKFGDKPKFLQPQVVIGQSLPTSVHGLQ